MRRPLKNMDSNAIVILAAAVKPHLESSKRLSNYADTSQTDAANTIDMRRPTTSPLLQPARV